MKSQLTYSEFKARRQAWKKEYEKQNGWAVGLEEDAEGVTKLAYKMYLKGRVPSFAK